MHLTLISLSLGTAAVTSPNEPAPSVTAHFASEPQTCEVLQAAYTAAGGHKERSYPQDVRSDARVLDLSKFVPEYRAKLALSAREFDELATQQDQYRFPDFKPACNWKGNPGPLVDGEGHATFVTFSSPIFSNSKRLAMVEVSFREKGSFGYGLVCVVRKASDGWKGHCQNSWIS